MSTRKQLTARPFEVPLYKSFRKFNAPVLPPLHVVLSLTGKCNARCLTCLSWERAADAELTVKEYYLLFKSMQFKPLAVTFTGGEPLVRDDFLKISTLACRMLSPAVVFIETCGDMPVRLTRSVKSLAEKFPNTHFAVSLSLPGLGARLNELRGGAGGAFENFLRSYRGLRGIGAGSITVAINIPVSTHNCGEAKAVLDYAYMMYPDLVTLTPVHGSEALGVTAVGLMPDMDEYAAALDYHLGRTRRSSKAGVGGALWLASRRQQRIAAANMRRMKQTVPCQAGHACVCISPTGSVKDCPVASRELGDLRENQFDFIRILNTRTARNVRRQVAVSGCFCPMDYAAFSHTLLSPSIYTRLPKP